MALKMPSLALKKDCAAILENMKVGNLVQIMLLQQFL